MMWPRLQKALQYDLTRALFPKLQCGKYSSGFWARLTYGNGDEIHVSRQETLISCFDLIDSLLEATE